MEKLKYCHDRSCNLLIKINDLLMEEEDKVDLSSLMTSLHFVVSHIIGHMIFMVNNGYFLDVTPEKILEMIVETANEIATQKHMEEKNKARN